MTFPKVIPIKLDLSFRIKGWFKKREGVKESLPACSHALPGAAFAIIVVCVGLMHQKDNVYSDRTGKRFVLTKYGFEPAELFNERLINERLKRELEKLKARNAVLEDKLQRKVNLVVHLKNRINSLKEKLHKLGIG